MASTLADTLFAQRSMAYFADLEQKINALTTPQVLAALKKRIDPKGLVIVEAGDFAAESTAKKEKLEK